jgi:uncharacterized membrane protein YkoI
MTHGRPGTAALIALVLALALAFSPVHASQHKGGAKSSEAAQISADRAASIARSATGGRVLKVERKGRVYQVRVLLDGKVVRNLNIDAQTGQLLN